MKRTSSAFTRRIPAYILAGFLALALLAPVTVFAAPVPLGASFERNNPSDNVSVFLEFEGELSAPEDLDGYWVEYLVYDGNGKLATSGNVPANIARDGGHYLAYIIDELKVSGKYTMRFKVVKRDDAWKVLEEIEAPGTLTLDVTVTDPIAYDRTVVSKPQDEEGGQLITIYGSFDPDSIYLTVTKTKDGHHLDSTCYRSPATLEVRPDESEVLWMTVQRFYDITIIDASTIKLSMSLAQDIPEAGGASNVTPPPAPVLTATPTASTVLVNGENVAFDAYNINGNNYFKLRDLAFAVNGTEKQFEVTWDGANNAISLISGEPYTAVGGEMTGKGEGVNTPVTTNSKILLDGKEITLTAYNIEGNNYFKLRDVGETFDFNVTWDGAKNTIVIDTAESYTAD